MVNQLLGDLKQIGNWNEVRTRFGKLINFDGEVPDSVVNRAFADEKFAFYLVMTKDSPQLQQQLLSDPRNNEFEIKNPVKEISNGELLVKASGALVKWAKAGFIRVDAAVYERRMAACHACPHLKEPSKKAVYLASKLAGGEQSVCGLCGCIASRKAKLPTESCPGQDPVDPSMSRWGDPVRKKT